MGVLRWTPIMVANPVSPAAAGVRNYWEHRLVREAVRLAAAHWPIRVAYDFGAGYGRMARVLAEFAERVVGFERDRGLVALGKDLNPDIDFVRIEHLGS